MENLFGQKIVNAKVTKNNKLRCYYDVEYKNKDKVKSLGCKWDKDNKKWYYDVVDFDNIENDDNFKGLLKMGYFPYPSKLYNKFSKDETETMKKLNCNILIACKSCKKMIKRKHLNTTENMNGTSSFWCDDCYKDKETYH